MLPTVLNYDLPSCSVHFSNSVRVQCCVQFCVQCCVQCCVLWRSTARGYRLVARTRLQSDRGLEHIIDILHKYSLAARARASRSSFETFSSTSGISSVFLPQEPWWWLSRPSSYQTRLALGLPSSRVPLSTFSDSSGGWYPASPL